jgi:hypothetical protein
MVVSPLRGLTLSGHGLKGEAMQGRVILALTVVASTLLSIPLFAHHAFQAEFDDKKPVHLVGKVTKMEWINPHAWIHIDVTDADGKVTSWMVECGSPNIMLRRGFTKESLEFGTVLTVDGYQAKNGSNRANGSSVTFRDGRRLFVGGSNPDIPTEQR